MADSEDINSPSQQSAFVLESLYAQLVEDNAYNSDHSDHSYDDEESYVLRSSSDENEDEDEDEGHLASEGTELSLESSEKLHDILRNNSRGDVAQNYHHDHLLHHKWLSQDRPSLRRGECVICPKRRMQIKPKMAAVEAFADEGCFYCQAIREIIMRHVPKAPQSRKPDFEWIGGKWSSFGVGCDKHANTHPQYGDGVCGFEIFVPPDRSDSTTDLSTANLVIEDSGSEEAFRKASSWLQQCLEKHEHCQNNSNANLPRRVLDLGAPELGGSLQLYETTGNEAARYICLSHCWGDARYPAKTTALTIDQNKANIPWISLPKTFQDAITLARWLKVRYLWIDSLCIIQDSKQDWMKESAKMIDIYRGSFLTIAATGSTSDHGGCFTDASPQSKAQRLTGHSADGKPYDFYFRTPLNHTTFGGYYGRAPDKEHYFWLRDFPLLDRAWCYQEILLSPRVLHFSNDEMFWECMEHTTCECAGPTSYHDPSFYGMLPKEDHVLSLQGSTDDLEVRWRKIVAAYSSLKLTFAKDKLPAISGLAKQMQSHRQDDTYLAGLWRNSLIEDLLWRVTKVDTENEDPTPKKPSWRPAQWRAPSWSWASVGCRVEYPCSEQPPSQEYIQIVDTSCVPAGADETSEVLLAEIVLSGRLIPAAWWERIIPNPNTRSLHLKLADSDVRSWYNRLDDFRYPIARRGDPYNGWPLDIATDLSGYLDYWEHPSPIMPKEMYYCVPVAEFPAYNDDGGFTDVYLILTPTMPGSTHYQRFGLALLGRRAGEGFPFLHFPESVLTLV
ncbi:HET-domain-containing protein [Lepidopterella palustris CBS 459.81]|uniref:HET-domain-containing protein n=1 Tax=Lepidopterella palustris CBS 459.81 TaxID=1314670 RepID=A0A8E2JAZ0_9PEZI|nr:HET-domain-containing protein [Lepidopterella palustris CBS 459.81]